MIQKESHVPETLNLVQALLSHRRAMMWMFCCVMLVTIAMTFLGAKQYTSEAKLYVRVGRESTAVDPTAAATTNRFVTVHAPREYEINSVLELFNSRDVLCRVVNGVGPTVVLGQDPDEEQPRLATFFPVGDLFAPYSMEDEALEYLTQHLEVQPVKDSHVITIAYEAVSPKLAQDVVGRLVDHARQEHIRVNRTDGSQEFFVKQANHLRERLERLEQELCAKKNAANITSLEDQRSLMLKQVADLQFDLLETEASLSATTAGLQSHERLLETLPETITLHQTTGMPQSAVASMREQLFVAQVREKELLSRFTKNHPQAIAAAEHIAALEAVLAREPNEPQLSRGPNVAHQQMNVARMQEATESSSLAAHAAHLRKEVQPFEKRLASFNDAEAEFARLQREIEIETENYKRYSECLEQSRIDHELAKQDISNLNVLQPPSYSVTPTSPRPALNLTMGFIIAVSSSVGLGLMLEHRKSGLLYRLAGSAPTYEAYPSTDNGFDLAVFDRGAGPSATAGHTAWPQEGLAPDAPENG